MRTPRSATEQRNYRSHDWFNTDEYPECCECGTRGYNDAAYVRCSASAAEFADSIIEGLEERWTQHDLRLSGISPDGLESTLRCTRCDRTVDVHVDKDPQRRWRIRPSIDVLDVPCGGPG